MKNMIALDKLFPLLLFLGLGQVAHASGLWFVDGIHGNDGNNCRTPQTACRTIGQAISLASSGDSILVAAATYNEVLTIGKNLSIIGQSASTTIIEGGGNTVVTIANPAVQVSLSQVTVQNGLQGISNVGTLSLTRSIITGNGFRFIGHGNGGGIFNSGTLTIRWTTISRNGAATGGGIYSTGTLGIWNSTLSGNGAGGGIGGGIVNSGVVTINNSTLDNNSAYYFGTVWTAYGGALSNSGQASINNVTFSDNAAKCKSVMIHCEGFGGAIYSTGTLTTQNSIFAYSQQSPNCSGSGITSSGYNLSSDHSCDFNQPGDLRDVNPLLGTLQNNGGPTQTNALSTGSPAIDAGNPAGCTDGNGHLLGIDQRGMPRPDPEDQGGCDMGAYERQSD